MRRTTKMIGLGLGLALAGGLLAGCADDYYGGDYGPRYTGYYYTDPADVWYDGYYGPYAGGRWDDGGVFLFSDGRGGWLRDNGGHFRHERFEGARGYRLRSY